ncbi:outer membrane protein assembly factor BamD [Porphyromonas sp.]|uniref:outer membrane protein assembly factor BamD n=1 Tax=Porphyromonas sp. TaxID=1924944 RepID=UPI0026DB40FB|nr:outer membrane protein assembly factor BamD [Porphyromonas sp.]MDO4771377.1 outer membrane protein assembly factor BamD [Porphyromonas sp.]
MKHYLYSGVSLLLLLFIGSGCSEFVRIQKSTDIMEKYSYAKKYYNTKKYQNAATLLEEVVPYLNGTSEAETSLYLLGQSYYASKQYYEAHDKFVQYYTRYPSGEFSELARFYSGYGLAQDIPDARLDQGPTYAAIKELQGFLDNHPQSEKAEEAREEILRLQEHLAYKTLLSVRLYYNLGNYIFNNYESCIITARNGMKDFPFSKHKEEMHYLVVASLYEMAYNSVIEKQQARLRDLRDEYYNYLNDYPEGKYAKKLEKYFLYADKNIKDE